LAGRRPLAREKPDGPNHEPVPRPVNGDEKLSCQGNTGLPKRCDIGRGSSGRDGLYGTTHKATASWSLMNIRLPDKTGVA